MFHELLLEHRDTENTEETQPVFEINKLQKSEKSCC